MSVNAMETRARMNRPVAAEDAQFTIGQIARLTGVHAKTIRYYESVGLLPTPARSENHYRRYTRADVNRLTLLQRIRSLGAPLPAARSLLAVTDTARCATVREELLALVDERLHDLDRQMAALRKQRAEVERYQRA
ncbi:MAG: MerR family transcriptional regulator, partial [Ktedonobacterales bacterium]